MSLTQESPLLSVVIPMHNVGPWIRECLEAVSVQGISRLEVICVDDHSTDDTFAVVNEFVTCDGRFRLVRSPCRGGGSARNIGSALASGQYLMFIDGDDIVLPGAFERLVGALEDSGSDLVVAPYQGLVAGELVDVGREWKVFDRQSVGVPLGAIPAIMRRRCVWNKVFRKSFWDSAGIVFPDVIRANDIVPITKAIVMANSIDVITDNVYVYRMRPGNTSMTSKAHRPESLLSYLSQEVECAKIAIREMDASSFRAYSRIVTQSDLRSHLFAFLDGGSEPTSEQRWEMSRLLRELLELLDPYVLKHLDIDVAIAFVGLAADRFETVRSLRRGQDSNAAMLVDYAEMFGILSTTIFDSYVLLRELLNTRISELLSSVRPNVAQEIAIGDRVWRGGSIVTRSLANDRDVDLSCRRILTIARLSASWITREISELGLVKCWTDNSAIHVLLRIGFPVSGLKAGLVRDKNLVWSSPLSADNADEHWLEFPRSVLTSDKASALVIIAAGAGEESVLWNVPLCSEFRGVHWGRLFGVIISGDAGFRLRSHGLMALARSVRRRFFSATNAIFG